MSFKIFSVPILSVSSCALCKFVMTWKKHNNNFFLFKKTVLVGMENYVLKLKKVFFKFGTPSVSNTSWLFYWEMMCSLLSTKIARARMLEKFMQQALTRCHLRKLIQSTLQNCIHFKYMYAFYVYCLIIRIGFKNSKYTNRKNTWDMFSWSNSISLKYILPSNII